MSEELQANRSSKEAKLNAIDAAEHDWFGWSVSLWGDVALVGAYGNDDVAQRSGSAYVFRFDGAGWVEEAKLLPSDGGLRDHFGISIDLAGDRVIVGAHNSNGDHPGAG